MTDPTTATPPPDLTGLDDAALTALVPVVHPQHLPALFTELDRRDAEQAMRLRRPDALRLAALWYAGQGIPVFPLVERGKRPLYPSAHRADDPARRTCRGECGRDGHGLYDATTSLDTVRVWWGLYPAANIGAPTGVRFDVIDVDGPTGHASLADLYEHGHVPPTLGRAWTAGGGLHLLIAPTGDGNAAGVVPGIDYRGVGGYVVVPPSVGESGRRYTWIEPPALLPLRRS